MGRADEHYQDVSSAALNAKAVSRCEVSILPDEDHPEDIVVRGCPNCGHETVWVEPVIVVRGIDVEVDGELAQVILEGFRAAGRPVKKREVTVRCQCKQPHPGAPPGVTGCGRWWSLTVAWGN